MSNIGDGDAPVGIGKMRLPNIAGGGGLVESVPTFEGQHGISNMETQYSEETRTRVRLVAQIFGKPDSLVMKEILGHEPYIHLKTAKRMNFYFPGYKDGIAPSTETFSLERYVRAQEEMEQLTTWKGGLETYLFLMNSVYDVSSRTSRLDYSGVVALTFERAMHDKAIPSVAALLSDIIQFVDGYTGDDPTWGFSDEKGLKLAGSALEKVLLHLLPKWLSGDVKKAKHFKVTNVSR